MNRRLLFAVGVALLAMFFSNVVSAQWVSDSTTNTAICTATGSQQNPEIVSDGADGAIIIWEDYRNSNWDIYAQHLDASGKPMWAAGGINICTSTASQTGPVVVSDGSGGAYVVFRDARRGGTDLDIYGQHVKSDGSLAYGATGIAVGAAVDASQPTGLTICTDGYGGAFVAWSDSRKTIAANAQPDIYMNKLTSGGVAWGGGGLSKVAQPSKQIAPKLTDDGNGGCVLSWISENTVPACVRAMRINSSGSNLWSTDGNGVIVYKDPLSGNPSSAISIDRDGSQFMFAFQVLKGSDASSGWNLFAQRLALDGSLIWNTSTSAPDITGDWFGDQIAPIVFSDDSTGSNGNKGLLVVYENDATKNSIVMTRLLSDGSSFRPSYPNHLFPVCNVASGNQGSPVATKIGSGELIVAWVDNRTNTNTSIYAQRVDRLPKRYLGPTASNSSWGEAISKRANSNADQVAIASRTNGAIIVWRDNRNGNNDIYAQVIFKDGTLPIELSAFDLQPVNAGSVLVSWETSSEKDNAGFEVERRMINSNQESNYETVASYLNTTALRGATLSNTIRKYSAVDVVTEAGMYEYRLVDVTLDGNRSEHPSKIIEVQDPSQTISWNLEQNYPNPFTDKTTLKFEVPESSIIDIEIVDALGRSIAKPISGLMERGMHTVSIGVPDLGQSNSVYYCTMVARDIFTGTIKYRSPKAMMIQVLKN